MAKRVDPESCRAWQLLMKFYFVQRRHLPEWAGESGLSQVQCHVLHLMDPGRPVPMARLAESLSCDASNVTGLVDRMEARGLVSRARDSADRRVITVYLSAHGREIVDSLDAPMQALHERQFEHLSRSDLKMLDDLLSKVRGDVD